MKTYVSFILDETGSMDIIRDQTIEGFNEYLGTLKQKPKDVRFTLTQFNSSKVATVYSNAKLATVKELTRDTYRPYDMTPLYDAIGVTIKAIGEDKENVIIVIQTDGGENASKEYTHAMILELIRQKQEDGWTFVFLGADIDSYAISQSMGILPGNVISYSGAKAPEVFSRVAKTTSNLIAQGLGVSVSNFAEQYEDTDGQSTSE